MSDQRSKRSAGRERNDIFELTETESSSSSNPGVFENNKPFVLELYELTKDDPSAGNQAPERKVKKLKKKKKAQPDRSHTSLSSGSISERSSALAPPFIEEMAREEFYDARESYHALSENQASTPMATAALMLSHSEHIHNPKNTESAPLPAPTQPASITQRHSSTISKPVTRPE